MGFPRVMVGDAGLAQGKLKIVPIKRERQEQIVGRRPESAGDSA